MGPIDIKYHVISLAAVFLALGVGIIVGSSTNFFGISSILERQNQVILKLEANYKGIKQEVRQSRDELRASEDYVKELEGKLVPQLLAGKLDGVKLGVVIVGDLPNGASSEESLLLPVKNSGAQIAFKMRITLARLQELAGENQGEFVPLFGKELLRGSAFSSRYTGVLVKDGNVVWGGFQEPVSGILFVLGKDLDQNLIRDLLLPLEKVVQENKGVAVNAAFGPQDAYFQIFRITNVPLIQNVDTLKGQVEAITTIDEGYKQQQGLTKSGA